MSESINCTSCGAGNLLPESKKSMFCAFCGSSIVQTEINSNQKNDFVSALKVKPSISQRKTIIESVPRYDEYSSNFITYVKEERVVQEGGELSLVNRKIKNFEEITVWFSDNELNEITKLNLESNNLSELNQLERFTSIRNLNLSKNDFVSINSNNLPAKINLEEVNFSGNKLKSVLGLSNLSISKRIDLSNNQISILDDFPIKSEWGYELNLSNNSDLVSFSESTIDKILKLKTGYGIKRIDIRLLGCDKFDFNSLEKIFMEDNFYVCIHSDVNTYSDTLKNLGFDKVLEDCDDVKWSWRFPKNKESSNENNSEKGNSDKKLISFILAIPFVLVCFFYFKNKYDKPVFTENEATVDSTYVSEEPENYDNYEDYSETSSSNISDESIQSTDVIDNTYQIGQDYEGATIFQLNEDKKHGLAFYESKMLINFKEANNWCSNNNYRLPSTDEIITILNNFEISNEKSFFWSSELATDNEKRNYTILCRTTKVNGKDVSVEDYDFVKIYDNYEKNIKLTQNDCESYKCNTIGIVSF